jgi:tetratricopeptide (TPR) repeat protein
MEAYADAIGTYERVGKFYASQGFALKAIAVYKQIREIIAKHVPQLEERYAHITPKLAELYQQLGLTSDALAALDEVATRFQRQSRDPRRSTSSARSSTSIRPIRCRTFASPRRSRAPRTPTARWPSSGSPRRQLVKLGRRDDALKVTERLLHHKADPAHARIAAELLPRTRNQPNDGMQALSEAADLLPGQPEAISTPWDCSRGVQR